jgi:glucose-1-phosphate cytidylyltransferase
MANYADGLSDLNLHEYLEFFERRNKVASFLAVRPSQSFHHVTYDPDGLVTNIAAIDRSDFWINGGFFLFRHAIFDYLRAGEELVIEPFQRLIAARQLVAYRNPGFWACMDTFKEKMLFDEYYTRGQMPWAVWESQNEPMSQGANGAAGASNGHRVLLDRSNLVPAYLDAS